MLTNHENALEARALVAPPPRVVSHGFQLPQLPSVELEHFHSW